MDTNKFNLFYVCLFVALIRALIYLVVYGSIYTISVRIKKSQPSAVAVEEKATENQPIFFSAIKTK